MATSRKAGPPVPPRPINTSHNLTGLNKTNQNNDSLKNSISIKTSSTKQPNLTNSFKKYEQEQELLQSSTTIINSATGRTVIYKSPSFDMKKKQLQQQQQHQENHKFSQQHQENHKFSQHQQQQSQKIKISSSSNQSNIINTTKFNKNILELNSKNINGNNNINRNLNESSHKISVSQNEDVKYHQKHQQQQQPIILNRPTPPIMRRNRTEILIRNDKIQNNEENNINNNIKNTNNNNNNNLNKYEKTIINNNKSPIPKPRTLLPIINSNNNQNNNINNYKNNINIINNNNNNNNNNQRIIYRSHSTLCSVSPTSKLSTITTPIIINNKNNNINNNNYEIENNLKNVAERLFTEIIVNQTENPKNNQLLINNNNNKNDNNNITEIINNNKPKININLNNNNNNYIEKTEHCISVRSTPSPQPSFPITKSTTAPTIMNALNLKKTSCVNLLHRPEPEGECEQILKPQETNSIKQILPISSIILGSVGGNNVNSSNGSSSNGIIEKKVAFHEILIDELTAMRVKSSFKKDISPLMDQRNIPEIYNNNIDNNDLSDIDQQDDIIKNNDIENDNNQIDNDENKNQLRKRYPSGCSTDSSPFGTQRSTGSNNLSRIRTSDWIEVGDNGKKVTLTSCNISLEDSGLEDEIERLEDYSSGVGDSWDSVKDNKKRMCLPGLPPLPKSLSGICNIIGTMTDNETNSNNLETHQIENIILNELNCQKMTTEMQNAELKSSNLSASKLDEQLAVLRKEMFGLRQLDLSLLSQLWALNDSIQEFRTLLQENDIQSPRSPSPYPSDVNSVSSDGEAEDDQIVSTSAIILKTKSQQQEQQQKNNYLTVGNQQIQHRMRNAPPPPPPSRKVPQRPK